MMKRKKKLLEEQRHDYDARQHKNSAYIDWFHIDSSWAPPAFVIPAGYSNFFENFGSVIQDMLNNCDISSQNAGCLDAVIDAQCHIALRQLSLARTAHKHSMMEIELTKKAHLSQVEAEIKLLEKEISELERSEEE